MVNLEKGSCPLWNEAVGQSSGWEAHANPSPALAQGVSEQFQGIPALPWVGKLLAASQRGQWEGSWEEYLIQLEDRSETAAREREEHQHWVTTSTGS